MTTQVAGHMKGTTAALVALTAASCLQVVDPTANNIAIVGASVDLDMSSSSRAFAASVGTLSLAAFILTTGALGDRLGRRKVMLAGLVVAIAGGVLTAIAPTTAIFILGRAVTGVGIAASFGLSFALLREVLPNQIPKAVAFWLAGQTAAALVLGVVAGWLAGFGWRFGYLAMPIVAVIALLMCLRGLPEAKADSVGAFDYVGLGSIAVSLIGLIYGLSNAASYGWGSTQVLVPVLVGLVFMALFIWWEGRIAAPAFPVKLFKDPELAGSVAVGFSFNMWQAVVMIQLSMLWQYVYQYTPLQVSLGQLPMSLAMVVGAVIAGRLLSRGIPASLNLIIGHVLLIGTMVLFGFSTTTSPYVFFAIPMIVGGFARMLNETTMGQFFVAKPPPALTGAMASSKTAIGQTSFALGTALSSTFLFGQYGRGIAEAFADANVEPSQQGQYTGMIQQYVSGGDMSDYDPAVVQKVIDQASEVFLSSFNGTMFIIAGFLAFFAIISTLFFAKANRDRKAGRLVDGPLTLDGRPAALAGGDAGPRGDETQS
ncbi:MFS transporter [Krasilnikoviella flava]|uniref:Predicted arabinose efflux permease, MFS family n=1 Tax=Krasilnikoviella flava TaxID=526729 RepID=A0A1T5K328_9MICO|nr:MFS transporter [Krasilnikoviella flava]SKC58106.1 Predicted arabinose efflux permease, MFS family [Krasilnikoviella flava]